MGHIHQTGTADVSATDQTSSNRYIHAKAKFWLLVVVMVLLAACSSTTPGPVAPTPDPIEPTESRQVMFGSYVYGGVWGGIEPIRQLEQALGRELDIVHWFMSWDHAWDPNLVQTASQNGQLPMISWEPHHQSVRAIAAGDYDDYLRSWARGVKAHSGKVYLRPFPEMNGDWVPWNGDPDGMVLAWQRMASVFEQEGAENVRWVWSPNETDEPRTQENKMERYYPGSEYVDILAVDGYNWGNTRPWSEWRSFDEVFAQPYERLSELGSQPIWIAELASTEEGGNKQRWVQEMFASDAFPRLEALVWFNEDKESDWRIESSSASLAAFQSALSEPILIAGVE